MMGVRRFHSVEDMPGPHPRPPLDPENIRLVLSLMDLARHLSPVTFVPGVRKFRSVEEAAQRRQQSEVDANRRRSRRSRPSRVPPRQVP